MTARSHLELIHHFLMFCCLSICCVANAQAQDALKDRVDQLVEKLASDDPNQAKMAEDSLIKLGPRVLPLLPPATNQPNPNSRDKRIQSIRNKLAQPGPAGITPSRITIEGDGIRLSDAINQLQRQSGNNIVDLREQNGQEVTNPQLNLKIKHSGFFKALDEIASQAGLSLNFFTTEGSIGFLNDPMADTGQPKPNQTFVSYFDAFKVKLNQISLSRDFSGDAHLANLNMELVWEPRLKPLVIRLETAKIKAIDDKGRPIIPAIEGENMEMAIRQENPIMDLNINLRAPERDAQRIAKLEITTELTLPGTQKSLTLPDITQKNAEVKSATSSLKILQFTNDPPVWKVTAELKTPKPAGSEMLDSYRQAALTPTVALLKADSGRIALNGGFSANQGSTPDSIIYEFLFVDITGKPADHGLVIEMPDELKKIPLTWSFENIPLP